MTKENQRRIEELRNKGYSYTKVGQILGISDNTVRSYCRRHKLAGNAQTTAFCKNCGNKMKRFTGRKLRKFC